MHCHSVLFNAARKIQNSLNAWVDCRHDKCRGQESCTGGWPLCTEEGRERLKLAKSRRYWPGEDAPDNETTSDRRMRRLNQDIEDARLKMKIAGFLGK